MSRYSQLYCQPRWRRLRARFLGAHPTCQLCAQAGRVTAASVVDHIVPHKGDESLFWAESNLAPLCKPCHDGAKQVLDRTGKLRGCDVSGAPLDPDHAWNR